MASDGSASPSSVRRLAARWRARLVRVWPILAAAVGSILLLATLADRPLLGIGLAIVVLVLSVTGPRAAAPRRTAALAQEPIAPPRDKGHPSSEELSEAIGDPLILCNAVGVVLFANRAASAAFGPFVPGDLIALRFRSPEMQALIAAALAGSPSGAIEHAERVPIERSFRVSATMVGDGRFALFFRDQSETRRIDRMRADFIANASHELRTPLASISGFIETLAGPAKNDPAARERFLGIMQSQTARMARLIDDLLSLSRLEMKPLASAETRIDLADLTRQVTVSLGQLIEENGMTLALDLTVAPVPIVANPDEIMQVLENLIENACKYGQAGQRLDISLSTDRDEASLTVRDFGPGIPTEHIPRLTERFYRVDVETSRAQKGTGLGLAIVKHILSRHQGRLTIRSAPGEGASFTIHLPLAEDIQT